MKRKIIFILIIIVIVGAFLIIGFNNKTFFKTYYEVTNSSGEKVKIPLPLFSYYEKECCMYAATFSTLRSVKSIQNILNKYVENLQSCYDESYFYDANLDITISNYHIENGFPFNKIYLVYDKGNYCEDEFVLDDNWITEIKENAKIKDAIINKCIVQNSIIKCTEKAIDINNNIDEVFNYISKENIVRIENKKNISIDERNDYYSITVYYGLDNHNYTLSIFKYNNYLAFKVTDDNDHSKNAIYNINEDINQLFQNIYNKYN